MNLRSKLDKKTDFLSIKLFVYITVIFRHIQYWSYTAGPIDDINCITKQSLDKFEFYGAIKNFKLGCIPAYLVVWLVWLWLHKGTKTRAQHIGLSVKFILRMLKFGWTFQIILITFFCRFPDKNKQGKQPRWPTFFRFQSTNMILPKWYVLANILH